MFVHIHKGLANVKPHGERQRLFGLPRTH